MVIIAIIAIIAIIGIIFYSCYYSTDFNDSDWLESVGSRILYELNHRNPVLFDIPIQNTLGKPPVVPIGDTQTIPHHLCNVFLDGPSDSRPV